MRSDYFPVTFSDLGSKIVSSDLHGGQKAIEEVTVSAFEQKHPGRSFAFSFVKSGRKVVYATDSELDLTLLNAEEVARDPLATRRLPEDAIRFMRDADLLIADGQYNDDDYRKGWGHARANTVVNMAIQAGAKQLAIFHHDPTQSDAEVERKVQLARERARAAGSNIVIFAAREGLVLKVE